MIPGADFKGNHFTHMSQVLNGWLTEGAAKTRACDEWNIEELRQLQALLYLARESSFDEIYQSNDDNRKMRKDFEDIEGDWKGLTELLEVAGTEHKANNIMRDGHCHEVSKIE